MFRIQHSLHQLEQFALACFNYSRILSLSLPPSLPPSLRFFIDTYCMSDDLGTLWCAQEGALSRNACMECPSGRFSNRTGLNSLRKCDSCPGGTWSDVAGATKASVCVKCAAGKWSPQIAAVSEAWSAFKSFHFTQFHMQLKPLNFLHV